jgi:radical SAM superfamily enzyme YgiQ (UPF0313 family)
MRILLIEPPKAPVTLGGEDVFLFEPLALEYLAAGLSPHHDVRILDMRLDRKLLRALDDFSPDVVGITAYTVHVKTVRRMFETIKRRDPRVLTVVGGHHATVRTEDFLSAAIDVVVVGEGVEPFRKVVARFERCEGLEGIAGVGVARGRELLLADPAPPASLDDLPLPSRGLTAPYRRHYYSEWMKPLASIRTSKGCPYRCSFCALWKIAGGRYLRRRPESVVEELGRIDEDFVFFADDESLVDAPRMKTLAHLIGEAGILKRYFLYGRSDTIARNPELVRMWRDVGLERVFVGLEFFRDEDLRYVGKGSTTDDNRRAVAVLHDFGVEIYASFILRPEFTRDDFSRLTDYCHELDLDFASFGVLTPLPGTDLMDETQERLITDDYDYFDFIHTVLPTTLPLDEFYSAYARLYKQALSQKRKLALLRKFRLRDLPVVFARSLRWDRRLRGASRDYAKTGPRGPSPTDATTASSTHRG